MGHPKVDQDQVGSKVGEERHRHRGISRAPEICAGRLPEQPFETVNAGLFPVDDQYTRPGVVRGAGAVGCHGNRRGAVLPRG
jgi:hypothetical protein